MKWVALSDVNIDTSQVFKVDRGRGEQALATSVRSPIIVAKRDGGHKYVVFGFGLCGTDLTLRVAFPLLLVNTLDWFAGDDADLITTYATGVRQRVPLDGAVGVREAEPDRARRRHHGADPGLRRAGHVLRRPRRHLEAVGDAARRHHAAVDAAGRQPGQPDRVADRAGRQAPDLGGQALAAPEAFAITHARKLWIYLLLGVLALLGLEWITYHRRITV